jgi:hypothetical protein
VHDVLETVDRGDLSFTAFVGSTDDGDFVIFSDRDRANLYSDQNKFEISKRPSTYVVLLT